MADQGSMGVFAVDSTTGERRTVSDSTTGSGTMFISPTGIAVDAAGEHALVIDSGLQALIVVDLGNGARTVISQGGVRGAGTEFQLPIDVALDEAGKRAWVVEAILSAALDSGDRTILSDATTGSGAPFTGIERIALDTDHGRALVTNNSGSGALLLAVDLASGTRTVLSDTNTGSRQLHLNRRTHCVGDPRCPAH